MNIEYQVCIGPIWNGLVVGPYRFVVLTKVCRDVFCTPVDDPLDVTQSWEDDSVDVVSKITLLLSHRIFEAAGRDMSSTVKPADVPFVMIKPLIKLIHGEIAKTHAQEGCDLMQPHTSTDWPLSEGAFYAHQAVIAQYILDLCVFIQALIKRMHPKDPGSDWNQASVT